jgi:hypothetical protein
VQLVGKEKDKLGTYKLEEENGLRKIMIFWPIVLMVGVIVILIIWKPKGRTELWTEMSAEEKYMLAKKIFTRDPASFKDKDSDGIEDELEKGP